MAKKKKLLTTVVAVATAAALLLSGTFAWQSINQTALNEASDVINPGGRLHDDFDGTNKDVYVENFADEDIFARIQLSEYFEIVLNYGTAGEKTETIVGSKTTDENGNVTYGYDTHYFGGVADDAHDYWTWETGGQTIYMPTFNKNKDSLEADLNGNYVDAIGGISNRDGTQYTNYTDYSLTENSVKTASAIYDIDGNMADELAQGGVDISDLIENGNLPAGYENSVALVSETHETNYTLGATLISMEEWKTDYNSEPGEYWVYDTDGWVYWAQAIKPDTATGLLLDGIQLNGVMDDTWYYAINVVAQFCTAGDMGSAPEYDEETGDLVSAGTGFYDTENGTAPSDDALTLLDKIGVNDTTPGTDAGETDPDEMQTLILTESGENEVYITSGDSIKLEAEDGADLSSIKVTDIDGEESNEYSYDPTTQTLTITGVDSPYTISDANDAYYGTVNIEDNSQDPDEMQTLYLTVEGGNVVYINHGDSVIIAGEEGADLSSILVDDEAWDESSSDWTYDADTGILTLNGPDTYYKITDATGTYIGEVWFEDSSYEEKIGLYSTIRNFESPDTGETSFVKPGVQYNLYVELTPEDLEAAPEGFAVASAVPALSFTGTSIDGTEFTLDESHYTLGEWTAFTYGVDDYGNQYYRATTTITFNLAVGYGTTVTMASTIADYEDDFGDSTDYVVSDLQVDWNDVTIDLYDPDGSKLTLNTVQLDTTYDIVVSMLFNEENIVIYSTNDTYGTVSDRVAAEVAVDLWTRSYDDPENFAFDEETGKLVVGAEDIDPNEGWEEYGFDEIIDELCIQFCIGDLLIDEGLDTETHCYVYDERNVYFPDEEPFTFVVDDYDIYDYDTGIYVVRHNDPKKVTVGDGLDWEIRNDITELVTFTITGNNDANTKIEKAEDGYYLTIGEDETAERITVTAAIEGRGKGSITVDISYATVLVNGEELTDMDPYNNFNFSAEGAGEYTFTLNGATNVIWSIDSAPENVSFDSETGVLTVTDNGSGNAYCTVVATIPYTYGEEHSIIIQTYVTITLPTTAE